MAKGITVESLVRYLKTQALDPNAKSRMGKALKKALQEIGVDLAALNCAESGDATRLSEQSYPMRTKPRGNIGHGKQLQSLAGGNQG